jgi:hypothetical protein
MSVAFSFVRPSELPSITRNFDSGHLFENTSYANAADLAIRAGASNNPKLLHALIGKEDFSHLLLRYTVGVRAARQCKRV